LIFPGRDGRRVRCDLWRMDDEADIAPAQAQELRRRLAVAAALRRLAQGAPVSEASL